MTKPVEKLKRRLNEFPNQSFVIQGKSLWCTLCKTTVNFERKCVIEKHISSKQHKSRKGALDKTPKLPVLVEKLVRCKDKWEDMVAAFTSAGVPLKVFSNTAVRTWIATNVKDGQTLPSETTLRTYLKHVGDRDLELTAELCKDNGVIVIADESIDIKNRKVLNVLVKPAIPQVAARLVSTRFLEKCDGISVSNAVLDTLRIATISSKQVVCFKTDNARYMLTAGNTLKGICSRMIHSTCWSHVLHLVSEEIRSKMKKADSYISSLKSVLVKAPSRREELLDCFEKYDFPRRLPPVPVITRWCTWLEAGSFHHLHFDAESEWIIETEDNSGVMHKLKKIVTKTELKQELFKINEVCMGISSSIKLLESRSIPASDVWLQLKSVAGLTEEVLGRESDKLNSYFEGRHPSVEFWREVQYLDPRKAASLFAESETERLPIVLKRLSDVEIGIHEIHTYRNVRSCFNYTSKFCVFDFWKSFSRELPDLSKLALTALSIPASSADVERSFSTLRRILTAQRNSFTEENLGVHLRMSYNENSVQNESDDSSSNVDLSDAEDNSDEIDMDVTDT